MCSGLRLSELLRFKDDAKICDFLHKYVIKHERTTTKPHEIVPMAGHQSFLMGK